MQRDEDIDKLITNMEFYLYMSQNEQAFILSKFDDLEGLVDEISQQRTTLKTSATKSKSLSFKLNNFARILSEFGPSALMDNYESINQSSLMSLEEMNSFVVTKKEQHRNLEAYAKNGTIVGAAFAGRINQQENIDHMDSLKTSEGVSDSLESEHPNKKRFDSKFRSLEKMREHRNSQIMVIQQRQSEIELAEQLKSRMAGASTIVVKN